jgi:hypothetical protein
MDILLLTVANTISMGIVLRNLLIEFILAIAERFIIYMGNYLPISPVRNCATVTKAFKLTFTFKLKNNCLN